MLIKDPRSLIDREKVAGSCASNLHFTMPLLIDEMDDRVAKAYGGFPDRIYIVGKDGRIAYQGGPGPFGFKPDEMEKKLQRHLAELTNGGSKRIRL